MDNDVQQDQKITRPSWKVWLGFALLSPVIFAVALGSLVAFREWEWRRYFTDAKAKSALLLTGCLAPDPWMRKKGPALTSYLISPSEKDGNVRLKLLVNRRGQWGREDVELDRSYRKIQTWSRKELVGDEFGVEWNYLYKLSLEGETTIEELRIN